MSYSPETLVLTLSRRCNLQCSHCIVEAGPREKETLDPEIIDDVTIEAVANGIHSVVIYGGEPFLHAKDLLPQTLRTVLRNKLSVTIDTNGFWGKTEFQAKQVLDNLEGTGATFDQTIKLSLSVDRYHQPKIPPQSIANIITQFRRGELPHLSLGIQTFSDEESWDILGQVYEACHQRSVYLVESNDNGYMYPALRNELIEFSPKNYARLGKRLELPVDADERQIKTALVLQLRYAALLPIIMRQFDIGEGDKSYVIFPEERYQIGETMEDRVINAGRARVNGELELQLPYENIDPRARIDYLVIAPNGQAYALPAQITTGKGVDVRLKPLFQVIYEVEKNLLNASLPQ